MKCICAVTVTLLIYFTDDSRAAGWNYHNVSEWGGICETGIAQSPINLIADDFTEERAFSAFNFVNYDIPFPAKITNNGHTVTITLIGSERPTINGGGLTGSYFLDHFHFHWQSEHTVKGHKFPLEMHLVHYSSLYQGTTDASATPGGLAVLGVLFEHSLDADDDFIPLVEVLQNVREPHQQSDLIRNISAKSFLPRNTGNYYRYSGSLTTPNCNEGVIWTVFEKTLPLSADQILQFENIWSEEGPLMLNYRPVQPLNNRVVYTRNIAKEPGGAPSIAISSVLIITLAVLPIIRTYLL